MIVILEHSPISENDIDTAECEYGFSWKVVLMGYGCRMLLGMIIACFVFLIGKPQWIVKIVGYLIWGVTCMTARCLCL